MVKTKTPFLVLMAAVADYGQYERNVGLGISLDRGAIHLRGRRIIPRRKVSGGEIFWLVTVTAENPNEKPAEEYRVEVADILSVIQEQM